MTELPQANPIMISYTEFTTPQYKYPLHIQPLPYFTDHHKPPKSILNFDCCDFDYFSKENTPYRTLNQLHQNATLVYQKVQSNSKYFATLKDSKLPTQHHGNVIFNSDFECGNLYTAYKIADKKYNLILNNDTNTKGCTQWYFFSIKTQERQMLQINIINLTHSHQKLSILPLIYTNRTGWYRGGENAQLYKNQYISDASNLKKYTTLSFTYMFEKEETVYFATFNPYALTTLQDFLRPLSLQRNLIKIKSLTIADNQCPVLTIGDSSKPLIILLARQHPQDVVTSFVVEGSIRFLLSSEGQQLRESYYFKILPMMCPDGVIHGNSICDTYGQDIAKKWHKVNKTVPSVQHLKAILKKTDKTIHLILDLHQTNLKMGINFSGYQINENASYMYALNSICKQVKLEQSYFNSKSQKLEKTLPHVLSTQLNIRNVLQIYISPQYEHYSIINDYTPKLLSHLGTQICLALLIQNDFKGMDLDQNILNEIALSQSEDSCEFIDEDKKKKKKKSVKQRMNSTIENATHTQFSSVKKQLPIPIPIPNRFKVLKPLTELNQQYQQIKKPNNQLQQQLQQQQQQQLKPRMRSYSTKTPEWNVRQH